MHDLLESLGKLLGTYWKNRGPAMRHSRTFICRCGSPIFFDNSTCLSCYAPLEHLPEDARLLPLELVLGLPVKSKVDQDLERGLMFDFLRSPPGGPRVLTGHANGLITLNIDEADDAKREQIRHELHEPYRTLLGHFRHEVDHYYWDRLISDGPWQGGFRALFGDERADYVAALKANCENGPSADWTGRFISAYASTHRWEDWAETWAHYLHMIDSLGTALGFGLDASDIEGRILPFGRDALHDPESPDADRLLSLVNSWIEMTMALNELARSMGQPDFYPFVMTRPVVAKLQFVHLVVQDAQTAVAAKGVGTLGRPCWT